MPCTQDQCRSRVVDIAPARLACYDSDLKIIWINEYSARLLDKKPADLIGRQCCQVWQNCEQQCRRCHMTKALETGEPQSAEIDTPHGRIWSLTAFPQKDVQGRIAFICEYGRDVTADKTIKTLEDEINAITRHDLKSPAIATLNIVRLIKDDDNLTQDQRELLKELERSGRHMLEIINQTMTLHKIEKGQYQAKMQRLDCLEVVRDVCAYFGEQRQGESPIRILVNGQEARPDSACQIHAEENLLRTALMNIIKNACEASPPGQEVTIDISCEKSKTIAVRNKGAVPASVRHDFFGKYVTAKKTGGTGLGTYSAKKMVEAQNAAIAMRTKDDADGGETEVAITF